VEPAGRLYLARTDQFDRKDVATAVIKSIYQNVTHDIDLQAD
jgi:hypothetical protein